MAFLFNDDDGVSTWIKQRKKFYGPDGYAEILRKLETSNLLYVGNLSFYTTEEQIYEHFGKCGEVKRVIMGLNKVSKTPCGFCFVEYFNHEDAVDAKRFLNGSKCDERVIRVDIDYGFEEGRQYGRGIDGGQIRDYKRPEYDSGRGGFNVLQNMIQKKSKKSDSTSSDMADASSPSSEDVASTVVDSVDAVSDPSSTSTMIE